MLVSGQATGILSLYTLDRVNLTVWGFICRLLVFRPFQPFLPSSSNPQQSNLDQVSSPSAKRWLEVWHRLAALGQVRYSWQLPVSLFPETVKVSPLWIVMFYALIMAGETFTSPVGRFMASEVAPGCICDPDDDDLHPVASC